MDRPFTYTIKYPYGRIEHHSGTVRKESPACPRKPSRKARRSSRLPPWSLVGSRSSKWPPRRSFRRRLSRFATRSVGRSPAKKQSSCFAPYGAQSCTLPLWSGFLIGPVLGAPHRLALAKSQLLEQREFDLRRKAICTGAPARCFREEFGSALIALGGIHLLRELMNLELGRTAQVV